jgi:HK97 family phage major capsid protein
MSVLGDLKDKNANVATLFRQALDEEVGPVRTDTSYLKTLSGETKQILDRLENEHKSFETQIKDLLAKNQEQEALIKAMQAMANRPNAVKGDEDAEAEKKASKQAFRKALMHGWGSLKGDERKYVKHDQEAGMETGANVGHGMGTEHKALFEADATTGGFLTTPEYVAELIMAIVLVSDMHSLVDVRTTTKPYVMVPKRTQTASASRIAEQTTRTETQNPKFGMVQTFPYESFALCLISRMDLDDSELDLGSFIMQEFGTQFAKLEGAEVINGLGSGAGQCQGFLTEPGIIGSGNYITSSTSLSYAVVDFTSLMHRLKSGYRKGATWVFTTATLGAIRGLTDSTGRPLWTPFGTNDLPGQMWGYPYAEMPDMPEIAANSFSVAFGNFKTAYQLVVRKQVSIQVLMERYADQNAVGYMGYYRFGGGVKLAEAIKVMKTHA